MNVHALQRLTLSVGFFGFWALPVQATTLPIDPALRMQDELQRLERAMPAAPAAAPLTVPAPELPQGPLLQGQIFLKEVLFSPSQLLSPDHLQQVVKPYLGRDVGSEELNSLLRDIQALYLAMGVQSAAPVVPQQDLSTGVFKVVLVEGTLGQIKFKSQSKAQEAWLSSWFDLPLGQVIRPEPLSQRLEVFNAASDFQAEGEFVPGQQFGQSDLELRLSDAPKVQYWAMAEAMGMGSGRTVGNSVTTGWRYHPVSAVGGRLDGMVIAGPEAATVSLSAGLPVGHQGWRLGTTASASQSRTRVASKEAEVDDLLVEGASRSLSLEVLRHVHLTPNQMWRLSGALSQVHSHSWISGSTLSDRSVQRLTLAAATDAVVDPAMGAERATLRVAASSAKGAQGSYGHVETAGSLAWRLGGAKGPVARLNGQVRWLASRQPDASDFWVAGGSASVRGFDAGAVQGRTGQALQLSLHQPLPWQGVDVPEAFAFADHARATKDDVARQIGSVGIGLQFQINRQWSVENLLTYQTQGFQGPRTRWQLRASVAW